ncbi:ETX/MTX2 family pore-forming toxin [Bacillus cereus group sp. N28]|uniref:ETX/MTX2 family pore-forming toxin n=1 Tax=Bacillus cereus group sp. N28 TaxID=2794593 RepID=UPI0018F6A3E9|nr:ETX/MTX2 family pore-forming toxin [Bacillus cereus group sp. N28]MBJ7961479.1 ETX/MTX2 family pore-forming toxin [Bacillus cereus group sp. N28]
MSTIIDIDQYLYATIDRSAIGGSLCNHFREQYQKVIYNEISIPDHYKNNRVTISNQKVDYQLPPLSSKNVEPLIIIGGTFKNETNDTQPFKSTEIKKESSTAISSSVTSGFKASTKIGSSTTVKAEIPFVGGGETSLSMEFSFETDFSKTTSVVTTDGTSILVPPQDIIVAPGQTKRLEVELYKVKIPEATFKIDGDVAGTISSQFATNENIYDRLANLINRNCPNVYVNTDEKLRLDDTKKTLHFKGQGKAAFEVMAVEYVMRIITLDNKTGATLNEETAVRQLSRTVEGKSSPIS